MIRGKVIPYVIKLLTNDNKKCYIRCMKVSRDDRILTSYI